MNFDWFVWALITAFIWGFMPFFDKGGIVSVDNQFAAVLIRSLGVVLGILVIPFISPGALRAATTVPPKAWIFLLISGFVGSVVGQVTNYKALQLGEVSRVSPVTAAWPVLAALIAVVFLGEPFTAKKCMALGLTLCGLILFRI
jgi:transporter family protein